jgi:hypothetical protein
MCKLSACCSSHHATMGLLLKIYAIACTNVYVKETSPRVLSPSQVGQASRLPWVGSCRPRCMRGWRGLGRWGGISRRERMGQQGKREACPYLPFLQKTPPTEVGTAFIVFAVKCRTGGDPFHPSMRPPLGVHSTRHSEPASRETSAYQPHCPRVECPGECP